MLEKCDRPGEVVQCKGLHSDEMTLDGLNVPAGDVERSTWRRTLDDRFVRPVNRMRICFCG